eukprot:1200945-Amphidinium_carterae.1
MLGRAHSLPCGPPTASLAVVGAVMKDRGQRLTTGVQRTNLFTQAAQPVQSLQRLEHPQECECDKTVAWLQLGGVTCLMLERALFSKVASIPALQDREE